MKKGLRLFAACIAPCAFANVGNTDLMKKGLRHIAQALIVAGKLVGNTDLMKKGLRLRLFSRR